MAKREVRLLYDGSIRFSTGKTVKPVNEVEKIEDNVVYFKLNNNKFTGKVDLVDYCRLTLWAHRLTFDHADVNRGVIAYDNGYEHKSLGAMILMTNKGQNVRYNNLDKLDCRRSNLKANPEVIVTKTKLFIVSTTHSDDDGNLYSVTEGIFRNKNDAKMLLKRLYDEHFKLFENPDYYFDYDAFDINESDDITISISGNIEEFEAYI